MQITNAQLNRDYSGRISATMTMLIAPEESDAVIARVKSFGRVENFQTQTERIAQGGSGMSENAKTKRDKMELNITISREEQAFQQTSLRIRTSSVDEKAKNLRAVAEKQGGRVRSSTFSRDPNGRDSQGNIVSHESGPLATLRRTLAQSAGAIMWSLRMIGVAIAFLAPWVIAIFAIIWIIRRVARAKR